MASHGETALLLRGCGMTYREIGERMQVTHVRAMMYVSEAQLRRETRPGFLDGPEELWRYERWGDRDRPRRPGFGHSRPGAR